MKYILKKMTVLMVLVGFISFMTAAAFNGVEAKSERLMIQGDHGALSAVLQTPDKVQSYPLVILMHGFSASKDYKLLELTAEYLEKAGIASIRFDFNGHGDSEGRFQDMTVPNEIEDAKKVYAYAKALPGVTNILLVGHSQGGVVASMLAGELTEQYGNDAVKGLVLLAPAANIVDKTIGGAFFGVQFDTDTMPEYIELPSGLHVGRDYFKTAYSLPLYDTAKLYTGPVTIIQGKEDTVVPPRYAQRFVEIYKHSTLEIVEGYDHEFSQNMPAIARGIVQSVQQDVNRTDDTDLKINSYLNEIRLFFEKIIEVLDKVKAFLAGLS